MSLRIYLLGQFKLSNDDQPLELPSRPAQSLLAYLALTAGLSHRREKLAGTLWPDATESNARSYLRQALWRFRKACDAAALDWQAYLRVDDVSVTLASDSGYWLDTEALLRDPSALAIDELVDAVQRYRGELLPGFYDEWIEPERERLQTAFYQQISQLVERLLAAGRWREAITWSEEWLRLAHAPEPAYRALMRAHAGLGDLPMVCATYERCAAALDRELGVEPSPETKQLCEQLRLHTAGVGLGPAVANMAAPEPLPFPPVYTGPPSAHTPFVAREEELARLERLLRLALDGRGQVAFVAGEAGSGKTALLSAFARAAASSHPQLLVAGGNCNAQTGIGDPYLPFREVLAQLTAGAAPHQGFEMLTTERADILNRALPVTLEALVSSGPDLVGTFVSGAALARGAGADLPALWPSLIRLADLPHQRATVLPPMGPSMHQSDLFEQYTRVLLAVAQAAPLLIMLDDLQWADLGSISLLFHLARRLQRSRLLVVGAYRPEDIAAGPAGGRHPLESVLNELRRLYGDTTIDLNRAAGRPFVEALVDSEPHRLDLGFKELLFRQTRGNPLFTVELLRGMEERGELVQDAAGRWIEGPALDWEMVPARVEAVIAERVGRLSPLLQSVLRAASVEGELFTAEVLAPICDVEERVLLGELDAALDRRHRLIRPDNIIRAGEQTLSTYRFRHTLIQKYVYGSLGAAERVRLHGEVGAALEALCAQTADPDAAAPQLAHHYRLAQNSVKAIHYLIRAGRRAVQLSAFREGLGHLQEARALLQSLPPSPQRTEQEIELELALALALQGTEGTQAPQMEAAYKRALALCGPSHRRQRAHVLGELALVQFVHGSYADAAETARQSLSLAQQEQDALRAAITHWNLGLIRFFTGHYARARDHFGHMLDFYDPRQHHQQLIMSRGCDSGTSALAYDACCLLYLGYLEQAVQTSRRALALAHELDHMYSLADVLAFGGCMFNEARGDDAALAGCSAELFRLVSTRGPVGWMGTAYFFRGLSLTKSGQIGAGLSLLEQGIEQDIAIGVSLYVPTMYRILGSVYAANGQPAASLRAFETAFRLIAETGEHHAEAELHRARAALWRGEGDLAAAETDLVAALDVARRQEATLWELRAAMDLADLWVDTARAAEGRALVADVYVRFTEGFEAPDLQRARRILEATD